MDNQQLIKTPWGKADFAKEYAKGIVFYTTPSHGGFKVSRERLKEMSIQYRNKDGWFEEDCEAMKVILAFPQYFSSAMIDIAAKSFTDWFNIDGTYRSRD